MESRGGERRLAAILAADMVGYSRLMEADERAPRAAGPTGSSSSIRPSPEQGRIIKTTGDGMLVEFQSVADAVECAAEIQRRMARRNADVSPARWIQFRIGINLGDVIVEDGDIFGDGVNVAARFEELAAPERNLRFRRRARPGGRPSRCRRSRTSASRTSRTSPGRSASFVSCSTRDQSSIGRRGGRAHDAGRREAVPGGAALRQHERRSRAGILRRRPRPRTSSPSCRASASFFVISAKLVVRAQGQGGQRPGRSRASSGVHYRGRGQRSQGRRPRPGHRAADRRRDRSPRLGRALRPQARGHLRHPGRGDLRDRSARCPAGSRPPRHDRAVRKPTAKHGGLRIRAGRQDTAPPLDAGQTMRKRSALIESRHRARPEIRAHARAWKALRHLGQTWVNNWCDGPQRHVENKSSTKPTDRSQLWTTTTATFTGFCAAVNLAHDEHEKAQLSPGARVGDSIPTTTSSWFSSGELLTWLGPARGRHRVDQEGHAAEPLPSRAILEPPRPRAITRRASTQKPSRALSRITRPDRTHHASPRRRAGTAGRQTTAAAHTQKC